MRKVEVPDRNISCYCGTEVDKCTILWLTTSWTWISFTCSVRTCIVAVLWTLCLSPHSYKQSIQMPDLISDAWRAKILASNHARPKPACRMVQSGPAGCPNKVINSYSLTVKCTDTPAEILALQHRSEIGGWRNEEVEYVLVVLLSHNALFSLIALSV